MINTLNTRYTFEKFIVGDNNRFAHDVSMAVAVSPGQKYNPLYLHSPAGLGKTHLMQSIASYITKEQPHLRVMYVDASDFTNELINSIKNSRKDPMAMYEFKKKYRREVDVLLVDDIQFLMGKMSTQEEFYNMFNELYMQGKQIVLSSDVAPQELETLDHRLSTRFAMGVVASISMPEYETRMKILESKQADLGIRLPEEPIFFIAKNIKSNVRQLEGALNKVIAYEKVNEGLEELTDLNLEEILKDYIVEERPTLSPDYILEKISEKYQISVKELTGSSRAAKIVFARNVCMYLMYNLLDGISLQQIGEILGGRNHATIIHGIKKISERAGEDAELSGSIDNLKKELKEMGRLS